MVMYFDSSDPFALGASAGTGEKAVTGAAVGAGGATGSGADTGAAGKDAWMICC